MEHNFATVGFTVGLALFFVFSNGFNDSANQTATVVSARALPPELALIMAAVCNYIGAYYLGTNVAKTILKNIVDPELLAAFGSGASVLIAALLGAVSWNLFTWFAGIPASSSHSLIGGLIGAVVKACGAAAVHWPGVLKIIAIMLISPFIGFCITYLFTKITFFLSQWASPRANLFFNRMQVISSLSQSLVHGANDAQMAMGIMVLSLYALRIPGFSASSAVPHWVKFSAALTMALGTAVGGWRSIRTLGYGLYRVRPIHGFGSQTVSTLVALTTVLTGYPTSTTQVASSSVLGAGAAFRIKSVRWQLAGDIAAAWLVTIPASALAAGAAYGLIQWIF